MAAPDSRGWPYNPLTLDLDGDGIELSPQSSLMPTFDIDGDYYAERTAWPKPDDGILVRDLNGNGRDRRRHRDVSNDMVSNDILS